MKQRELGQRVDDRTKRTWKSGKSRGLERNQRRGGGGLLERGGCTRTSSGISS